MAKPVKRKEKVDEDCCNGRPCCGGAGLIPGIIFLTIGVLLLLSDFNIINLGAEFILLTIGVVFIVIYSLSKVWAFLIPGIITFGVGLILYFNFESLGYLYPLVVGLSFLTVYITKQENTKWAIIPGGILVAVSAVTMFEHYSNIDSWPLILISVGLYLLYRQYKK